MIFRRWVSDNLLAITGNSLLIDGEDVSKNKMRPQILGEWLMELGKGLIELAFPPTVLCPACWQEPGWRRGLGQNCRRRIGAIVPPICDKCGRLLRLEAHARHYCEQCRRRGYYFNQARSVAIYDGALREYLAELKYRYRPELGEALGQLFVEWMDAHPRYGRFDVIIPIPLHRQKLAVRGYNQAELLANPLQRHLGIALKNDIIIRYKLTESQNILDREARFANLHDAFRVLKPGEVAGARVLLIDDILTTGATVSEAARVLLRAGAAKVDVLTLAMGVVDRQWPELNSDKGD